MRVLILLLMLLLPGLSQAQPGDDLFAPRGAPQTDLLPVEKAFRFTWERLDDGQVQLRWQIAPGYYLYQKRLRFDGLDPALQPQLPPGESHSDEFFGESQVYRQSLELTLPAAAAGQLRLGWQGCADAGLCYPPQSQALDLGGTGPAAAVAGTSGEVAEDQGLAGSLQAGNLAWSLLLFFGLGLLLAFAPCSLPMLPILAGLVVGSGAGPRRGLLLAGSYVLSMALVYAGLGVVAALLGGNLQAWLQQPWLLGSFAALFVFLALPMFGFFELQLPAALRDRLDGLSRGRKGGSLAGAAALGALSGLLVGPCMTAPLAGALLYIAQTGNALHGGLVLFSLGLGIGMPLLLLVTVGSRFLPKPGPWMNLVKGVFGFLFLGTAWILLRPLLGEALWIGLGGALLLVLAYAALHTARGLARHAVLFGAAGCIFGLWGAAMLLGAAAGADDPWRPLQVYAAANRGATPTASAHEAFLTVSQPAELDRQLAAAKAEGQWVLLDYYADWCVSCRIMEKQVFAKPDVLAALQGVRLLRLDVTADNAASRELLRRYQVPGPPSLIWIGPEGEERRARRLTGEVDAGGFLAHWQATRERG
ncbi:protein-disulfide reductase DsbD [Pseudomonas aeruginosa]|nr:protein-disulfide reductase DsbD [Pseudomonas aeruginosa]